jgi:hypothetical protein
VSGTKGQKSEKVNRKSPYGVAPFYSGLFSVKNRYKTMVFWEYFFN